MTPETRDAITHLCNLMRENGCAVSIVFPEQRNGVSQLQIEARMNATARNYIAGYPRVKAPLRPVCVYAGWLVEELNENARTLGGVVPRLADAPLPTPTNDN